MTRAKRRFPNLPPLFRCPAKVIPWYSGVATGEQAVSLDQPTESEAVAATARRKVAWRVLPPLLVIYIVAYLDRANVAFAKLRMQDDLKFSDDVFGLGFGLFFVGYLFLEIPGALLVEHWSARKWFARIL